VKSHQLEMTSMPTTDGGGPTNGLSRQDVHGYTGKRGEGPAEIKMH